MLINGSVINSEAINGPGTLGERVKAAIQVASDIPISARKEFDDYLDAFPEQILNQVESLLQLDLPSHLVQYADTFFAIVRLCAGI